MILSDVMDQIGDAVEPLPGLRVYRWPAESIAEPAAIVQYPEVIEYNAAFQRGLDRMTGGLLVAVSRVSDRASREAVSKWTASPGEGSVMDAIHNFDFTACSYCRVVEARQQFEEIAGVPYITIRFQLDIAGPGV